MVSAGALILVFVAGLPPVILLALIPLGIVAVRNLVRAHAHAVRVDKPD